MPGVFARTVAARLASLALAALMVFAFASAATAQQKAKKSAPNQYNVPSDQQRWSDPACNTFNT
jgi:hypothetical protein